MKKRVVVLGGGFGGLESAFYIKSILKDRVDMVLISDKEYFLFKPNTIYIPFGLDPEKLKIYLKKPIEKRGIQFIQGKVEGIDPKREEVEVNGKRINYEYLIIATGADMKPEDIPGLKENSESIWTIEDMLKLRKSIKLLIEKLKEGKKVKILFLVPPNNKCSGPLYEIVFMLDTYLRRKNLRDSVSITWATFEKSYIQAFGHKIHEIVERAFYEKRIEGLREMRIKEVLPQKAVFENGTEIFYDLLISFPPYIAAKIYSNLPSDERGFIYTDFKTRRVKNHDNIFAVGDTGDFPVKQAFLSFLQADVAAEIISSEILNKPVDFYFEPISMCVMERLDTATFAQVPVRVTGIPELPVEVDKEKISLYKAGTSKLWRLGKKILGYYLPWRFSNGNPFHKGVPWKIMEVGLRVMGTFLAN